MNKGFILVLVLLAFTIGFIATIGISVFVDTQKANEELKVEKAECKKELQNWKLEYYKIEQRLWKINSRPDL